MNLRNISKVKVMEFGERLACELREREDSRIVWSLRWELKWLIS